MTTHPDPHHHLHDDPSDGHGEDHGGGHGALALLELLWGLPPVPEPAATPDHDRARRVQRSSAPVPVLAGMQRQGDLLIVPAALIPPAGRSVLRQLGHTSPFLVGPYPVTVLGADPYPGQAPETRSVAPSPTAGGHTHRLTGTGVVRWRPAAGIGGPALLGSLAVRPGARAWATHTGHHRALGIDVGIYALLRQQTTTPHGRWRHAWD